MVVKLEIVEKDKIQLQEASDKLENDVKVLEQEQKAIKEMHIDALAALETKFQEERDRMRYWQ